MGDTLGCFKKPVLEALSLKPRVEGGLAAPDRRRGRLGIGSRGVSVPPTPGALCAWVEKLDFSRPSPPASGFVCPPSREHRPHRPREWTVGQNDVREGDGPFR